MTSALAALERLLLPNACVACEGPVSVRAPDELVCGACRSRLERVVGGCARCAQPLPPVGPCRFCAAWPAELRWVRSGYWLGPEASEIVHHLKYEGYRALGPTAAELLRRALPTRPAGGVLAPIPLARRRERRRGYNQAATIAHGLANRWRLPLDETLLRRVRETRSQTALDPGERWTNVAGAFVPRSPAETGRPRGEASPPVAVAAPAAGPARGAVGGGEGSEAAVILVDDVLTTGATIATAAQALAERGWQTIGAVTFARALPFAARAVRDGTWDGVAGDAGPPSYG